MEGLDEGQVDAGGLVGAVGVLALKLLAATGQVRQATAEHQRALVLAHQRVDAAHDTTQLLHLERDLAERRSCDLARRQGRLAGRRGSLVTWQKDGEVW